MALGIVKGGLNDLQSIKSIQTGSADITGGLSPTISEIDVSNSYAYITFNPNNNGSERENYYRIEIASSTQLTIVRAATSSNVSHIEWTVIEFHSLKSKQTGSFSTASNSDTVAVTSVNILKSLLFFSYTCITTTDTADAPLLSAKLNTSTQLIFNQLATNQKDVHWQLLEFN